MKMSKRRVPVRVFDFDGTLTVPAVGGEEAFTNAYLLDFAGLVNKPLAALTEEWKKTRAKISADPNTYGWVVEGLMVAPALVDAFVAAQVTAQTILTRMGHDLDVWRKPLEGLYQAHYLKHTTVFRPEVLEVLLGLQGRGEPFYIVTNSDPAKVRQRLTVFGHEADWIGTRVRGFAKKYVVTSGPESVPETIHFYGLERPVFLRKQHYHDVLGHILAQHDATWTDLVVIGDIAELDLALPVHLGARGKLILGPNTPDYERRWAESHPRVAVITNLREALVE